MWYFFAGIAVGVFVGWFSHRNFQADSRWPYPPLPDHPVQTKAMLKEKQTKKRYKRQGNEVIFEGGNNGPQQFGLLHVDRRSPDKRGKWKWWVGRDPDEKGKQ